MADFIVSNTGANSAEEAGVKYINTADMTDAQRNDFYEGWTDAGGYTGDLESPCPWCAPWTWVDTIPVSGATPYQWGESWWEAMADEVKAELAREAAEED